MQIKCRRARDMVNGEAAATKMPDCAILRPALLQLGRRGTVEHVAPGAIKQFERIGFDRERSALPAWPSLDLDGELVR